MEVLVSAGGQVVVIENVHKGEALFTPYSDSSGNQSLRRVGVLGCELKCKKSSFESVLMRWMKLEPIIQSEVSQKDKDQYSILTHIYGIYKDGNDNPICKTEKETQMYKTDFWTLWEKVRVGCFERTASKHVYYLG